MSACEGRHSDPTCGLTVRDGFQLTELLVVTFVDLALALHLHPFVLLAVRDVEDQPGFQEKMTVFVESPQLAIRAPAFVLAFDDVKALWVEGDDQPLGILYE